MEDGWQERGRGPKKRNWQPRTPECEKAETKAHKRVPPREKAAHCHWKGQSELSPGMVETRVVYNRRARAGSGGTDTLPRS